MKIMFLACSALLLCSCANPISTSSIDSSSRGTSEDSSVSTPKVEKNERLRALWLRLSDNNGILFQNENPLFTFLGDAAFTDENSGLITVGDQGIFQFSLTEEDVQLGDFVQEGELRNKWGLKVLSDLGKGEFDETEPGYFNLRDLSSPFASAWLSLVGDSRPENQLRYFGLQYFGSEVYIEYAFGDLESPFDQDVERFRIGSIGAVECQAVENLVRFPPTLSPRTSYDPDIRDYILENAGTEDAIPFLEGASVQFSDAFVLDNVQVTSLHSNALPRFEQRLVQDGFAKISEGVYRKTFRLSERNNRADIRFWKEGEREILYFGFSMEPVESLNFSFLNKHLIDSPFPECPPSSFVTNVRLTEISPGKAEGTATFSNSGIGREYWEESYFPLLRARGFNPTPFPSGGPVGYRHQGNNRFFSLEESGETGIFSFSFVWILS